jgi:hypothetical protein
MITNLSWHVWFCSKPRKTRNSVPLDYLFNGKARQEFTLNNENCFDYYFNTQ